MLTRRALPVLAAIAAPRLAQAAFPERPVTMVVPYAPGGSADVFARILAPEMSRLLNQPVVVELRPGAGGNIGAAYVASGPRADGHTILLASVSLATAPALQSLTFDPLADLTPLSGIGAVPNLLLVSPESPHRTLADLLAAARAAPGTISYGSSGPGTGSHLAGELLAAASGTELLHVPYRGSGAVYPDLIAQRIGFLLDAMGSASGQLRGGSVRALGITSPQRSPIFPTIPTLAEQSLPGYEFSLWFGFFARSGTPPEALRALEEAARAAVASPPFQNTLRDAAAIPLPADAAGFAAYYRNDVARWARLVREGRIRRLDS